MIDKIFVFGDSFMYGEESHQHEFEQQQFLKDASSAVGRTIVLDINGVPTKPFSSKEMTKYIKPHTLKSAGYSGFSGVVYLEIEPWGTHENYNGVLPPNVADFVSEICSNPDKAKDFLRRAGILEKEKIKTVVLNIFGKIHLWAPLELFQKLIILNTNIF